MTEAESLMQLALKAAWEGISQGQSPFGCAIRIGRKVVAVAHNHVLASTDITAHAEIVALREACRNVGNIHLTGALVASTCEPCPMCIAALHWARVETVYYGSTIDDATAIGFNELTLPAKELLRIGKSNVNLVPGVLKQECQQLFQEWRASHAYHPY
ncbi:MAG: nucleoside deaminase [Nitrospirales bacterium]|nr:nucleoside deaminase [Nitrospirales bacterium]